MSAIASRPPAVAISEVIIALLPLMAVVLVVFLITGLAIPVLPLHVHQGLGLGTFVVGLVSGSQFAASLVSRIWSGTMPTADAPSAPLSSACWRPPCPVCCTSCRFSLSMFR
jgi:hypothetical protein